MRPLFALVVLSSLSIAAAPQAGAAASTEVVQQRLSDGRILLTDRPVQGATTERSWQVTNDDPAAARQRATDVRTEAQQVSERIQRTLDQERRADMERERTRVAALAMAQQQQSDDEPVYYGGVVPYGYGTGLGFGRGHRRFGHHGKFVSTDRWGSTEKFGTVGKFGAGKGPGGRPQMFDGR